MIANIGVEVRQVLLPHGKDVNDVVTTAPDPGPALVHYIRAAEWVAGKPSMSSDSVSSSVATETIAAHPLHPVLAESKPAIGSVDANKTDEMVFVFGNRRWRVRGLAKNTSPGSLNVNLLVGRESGGFHVDRLELYTARLRSQFVRIASEELGIDEQVLKKDLGNILLQLEEAQDELLRRLLEPVKALPEMSASERDAALTLLRDPTLLDRVLNDFQIGGVVGEKDNLLLGYLASVSRKLERPLGIVIQSSSAAGKSSLMEAVLSFVPDEDRVSYSAMTGQSLFYSPASNLRHKVLAIAEEEGASRASYSLKLLQSDGFLTIASTSKESTTGRLVSQEYKVEGPVAVMLTTTSISIDEELLSRCVVLTVDESPGQTKRIHDRQRMKQTLEGVVRGDDRDAALRLQQNAQRLLRAVKIVNPFSGEMAFDDLRVQARRDHAKLLTLIETITFLHQHQRAAKTIEHDGKVIEYIEVEKADIETAEKLLKTVGAIGVGDLPPQTRKVLDLVTEFVGAEKEKTETADFKFSRRQLREALKLGDTTLKAHLRRLVDHELVVVHRSPHGRGVLYELAVEPHTYDAHRSGYGRGSVGPWSAFGRGSVGVPKTIESPATSEASISEQNGIPKNINRASAQIRDVHVDRKP